MFQILKRRLTAALLLLLGACACAPQPDRQAETKSECPQQQCPSCPVCPACPKCPAAVQPAPPAGPARLLPADWTELTGLAEDPLLEALPALRQSCAKLGGRAPWRGFCAGLGDLPGDDPAALRSYLRETLLPWHLVNPDDSDTGLVTGYYEPLIRGRLQRDEVARWPVHGVPDDLVDVELAGVYPELKKLRLRGRLDGQTLKPYWTRAEITALGAALPAPVLLWAEDPIELFFLQVQGSGRVELPDGERVRIGYADHNGHPYVSIGRWLIEQGEMTLAQASMDGIKDWAQAHPDRLQELLGVNPGYVFFRRLPAGDEGPLGALGVPLTAGRSVAVDPRSVPLGAPVFLDTTHPNSAQPLRRLVVAQDTGGAIKGGVRADFFWGFGHQAGQMAGRMRQQGRMWVLLPKGYRADDK